MGNPVAKSITPSDFSKYKKLRQNGDESIGLKGVGAKTINNDHTYLSAMFNTLIGEGVWPYDNPVGKIKQIKYPTRFT